MFPDSLKFLRNLSSWIDKVFQLYLDFHVAPQNVPTCMAPCGRGAGDGCPLVFWSLRSELCQQDHCYTLVPLGLALTVNAQNQVMGIIKTR